ncbi:MAG TPA: thioredoxin family protein [Janthinobacterium sp.]|nr:thioredoxin family protein [Janthinobacterium sp.]
MHFTLYSRAYCHLCQDMLDALQAMPGGPFGVTVIDVDLDAAPALLAKYDELVPVLFGDLNEPELCHYFLDVERVGRYLAAVGHEC